MQWFLFEKLKKHLETHYKEIKAWMETFLTQKQKIK